MSGPRGALAQPRPWPLSATSSSYGGRMSESLPISCTLPTKGAAADTAAIGALAQTAEDLGFDAVWISDHVVVPQRITVVALFQHP